MSMRYKVFPHRESISGKRPVSKIDLPNTMQERFTQPRKIDLGKLFDLKNSTRERKLVGKRENSKCLAELVCVGLALQNDETTPSEGAKRRYEAHFVSKLTDCDGENSETDSSLDFALDCSYLTAEEHSDFTSRNREVGRMLGSMINDPRPFLLTQDSEVKHQKSNIKSNPTSDFRPPTPDLRLLTSDS